MNKNNLVITTKCPKCRKEYTLIGEEELKEKTAYDYKCDECIEQEYLKFINSKCKTYFIAN